MSKQKVSTTTASLDSGTPTACISVKSKNDNIDTQRHGVDV